VITTLSDYAQIYLYL